MGDLTAILQAGCPLATAREAFAAEGQMLALDPPDDGATIGGVVATGDSGPLRHRYGGPRDLVLGVQVALPDGSLARAGSKVIKNVAGYDLAKLMTGAYGTLGVVTEVSVRLHPTPREWLTVVVRRDDPRALAAAARELTHRPLEAERLDLRWEGDAGRRARAALRRRRRPSARRASTARSSRTTRSCGPPSARPSAGRSCCASRPPSRAWPTCWAPRASTARSAWRAPPTASPGCASRRPTPSSSTALRARLGACVLLDAPAALRREVDPWGTLSAEPLMRRVKARFDPYDTLNPGLLLSA